MSDDLEPGARLVAHAKRVEILLFLAVPVLAWDAITSHGLGRVLSGATSVTLALLIVLYRFVGVPGRALVRWVAGLAGAVMATAGFALLVLSIWFFSLGSFAILGGLMAIPLGLGLGALGSTLVSAALARERPDRGGGAPG